MYCKSVPIIINKKNIENIIYDFNIKLYDTSVEYLSNTYGNDTFNIEYFTFIYNLFEIKDPVITPRIILSYFLKFRNIIEHKIIFYKYLKSIYPNDPSLKINSPDDIIQYFDNLVNILKSDIRLKSYNILPEPIEFLSYP